MTILESPVASPSATARRAATIEDYASVVTPSSIAVGASGRIAYVRTRSNLVDDVDEHSIWLASPQAQLTAGPFDTAPAWHPTSTQLVFVRPDRSGTPQLWSVDAAGGQPIQLTTAAQLPLGAGAPVFSPDGTRIAFGAPVERAVTTSTRPLVTRKLNYKIDGPGTRGSVRVHLFELDLAEGAVRRLTDGDWDAADPVYSPDGSELAFTAATDENSDLTLANSAWVVSLTEINAAPTRLGQATSICGPLAWAPNGDAVVAVGRHCPDIGNNELLVLHRDGRVTDRSLTAGLDRNVMPGGTGYPGGAPGFTADGDVVFCLRNHGSTELHRIGFESGVAAPVVAGEQTVVSGLALTDGHAVVSVSTAESFSEIAVVDLATRDIEIVTELNTETTASARFPVATERWFDISDGTRVQAWILRDPAVTSAGPLVLDVHGGPHNAWTGTRTVMHAYHAELVRLGYTVLTVNPRGSDGYGNAFLDGVRDSWGDADRADLLEPVETLVAEGIADPAQLVLTGYSYGGFMTCALTSITDRFAVAVAGGLVCDVANTAGASDEGILLQTVEFDPRSARVQEISPLARVSKVTTPTLILHGGSDVRCPVNQAEQWFAGLRLAGVETELVVYPEASHAFVLTGRPSHRSDYSRRLVAWVERHLSPTPARTAVDPDYWQYRLDTLVEKYGVAGASLGIVTTSRSGFDRTVVTSGVVNTRTGIAATPDTVFQMGSISKVWTATLIMQLVEEGLLDLDAPVRNVLPEFTVSDETASAAITTRHLLTHTSGIDGDVYIDTGRGDDCIERYVTELKSVAQLFTPGSAWAYCNAAFVVLGRVVEVLRGKVWDVVLRERIIEPLGLCRTTTLPEETILHSAAVGHVRSGDDLVPTPHFLISRSMGPAGLVSAAVEDLLLFAQDSMRDDPILLRRSTHLQMIENPFDISTVAMADAMGLTWQILDWDGARAYGHTGATLGQNAILRVIPSRGIAIALMTNGGGTDSLTADLVSEIARVVGGVTVTPDFTPGRPESRQISSDVERDALCGLYRDAATDYAVSRTGSSMTLIRTEHTNPSGSEELAQSIELDLIEVQPGVFASRLPQTAAWVRITVIDNESRQLLYVGSRAYPRVEDQ
ncbi:dipeptidyl aminopeptidase/acylaminoacyl peptidase/CubicO group peptidase (beta-lactamase class C family) [Rhodococcus sp. 27YEA15]|uniref:serine hydrolase n=1 Tax=Rhodococcus sp. 27YEA15 TaxID=3156259 RepID=UPI003C7DB78E